ncbi:MAG: hypothetical protein PVI91_17000, partial [Gammaproteobacteria bacterium]
RDLQDRRRRALDFLVSGSRLSVEVASLRVILDHQDVACVLIGTTSTDHLQNNLQAVEAGPLPEDIMTRARALQELDWAFAPLQSGD